MSSRMAATPRKSVLRKVFRARQANSCAWVKVLGLDGCE
jgi:hypothetical protein